MPHRALALLAALAAPAALAQLAPPPVLDVGAVPGLDAAGRASYHSWLDANVPRAIAVGANGRVGWSSGGGSLEIARARALERCAQEGGRDCTLYAENLAVVWPARPAPPPPAPPPALISELSYRFTPDPRFIWWGPRAARGIYVWANGYGPSDLDGPQPQPHVRPFNNLGFDVVRFDRYAMSDERDRAAGWLRDALGDFRRMGYRGVIVGGQSRGAWNALQMLQYSGLADAVIAVSPASHGEGDSSDLLAQADDLRALVATVPPSPARLAFVQFAGDPYASDEDARAGIVERLRPRLGALLDLDRPGGFSGHFAGTTTAFGQRYGECLLHFALDPQPPTACRLPPTAEAGTTGLE